MGKVVDIEKLLTALKSERAVVFTHGVFDLLHMGHLELLRRSKELGQYLIVGVDSDEAALAYKRKPVVSQDDRVRILASIGFVDYVLPLEKIANVKDFDYYYLKLYSELKPTLLTHGSNFSFVSEVEAKCRLVGIKNCELKHAYSSVTTSLYISDILRRFGDLSK